MQSRLMSLPMLTTRQQCLFYVIHFSGGCAWGCYKHVCCQTTPQLQNYSNLWMITYQENWIGHFVSVYARTDGCHDWMTLVSLLGSKRSLLNVSLHTVSSIEKCWLAKKCHLNLTRFYRMWLKLSATLKYMMPLTHDCSCSSVRRWTQGTHALSHTQKWGGFLKVDHWPEILSYGSHSRDFL